MNGRKVFIVALVGLATLMFVGMAQYPGPTPPQAVRIVSAPDSSVDAPPPPLPTNSADILNEMSNLATQQGDRTSPSPSTAPTTTTTPPSPGVEGMPQSISPLSQDSFTQLNYAIVGDTLYLFTTTPSGVSQTLACVQGQQAKNAVTLNGWTIQPQGMSGTLTATPGGASQLSCAVSATPPPTK